MAEIRNTSNSSNKKHKMDKSALSDREKEKIMGEGVTLKELQDKGVLPIDFHLFSHLEMKEYEKKVNKKRRHAFNERLKKYNFDRDIKW